MPKSRLKALNATKGPSIENKKSNKAKLATVPKKSGRGRKLFDSKSPEQVLSKLFHAWDNGCTDAEACFYARISVAAYQRFLDSHPELREEVKAHKRNPALKAKFALMEDLKNKYTRGKTAQWILERLQPKKYNLVNKTMIGEDRQNPFGGTLADAFLKLMKIDEDKRRKSQLDSGAQDITPLPNQ